MKRFLLRLALFGAIIVGFLSLLTAFTDARLRCRDTGRMKIWRQIEKGAINADVLILGNSHAHVQVNPQKLQAVFPGARVFNFGLEGYSFDLQLARYRFYRRYNKAPQSIIICADYIEFSKSTWETDRTQFLPYLYDSSIRKALVSIGLSRLRANIPFLKYWGESNMLLGAISGNSPLPNDTDRSGWDGYEPQSTHWNESQFTHDTLRTRFVPATDSICALAFQSFLSECLADHISVFVVFTPHQERFVAALRNAPGYKASVRQLIPAKIPFIDFSRMSLCADTSCFYNGTHLNAKGADIFSALLADSLRQYIIAPGP